MRALPKNLVLLINAVSQPIALMEDIGHSGFEIYVCYVTNVCMVVSNVSSPPSSNFSELSGDARHTLLMNRWHPTTMGFTHSPGQR